ncbi:MAG: 23S rRNA pseudouridine(1911/1915/1917) synthase RluD [Legionella sp.]|nr:23S rRNA pseudouridine(1911/1915/1917) synthase RluD [Legionella sp.]
MIDHIQKKLTVLDAHHNQRIDWVLAQLLPEYSRSLLSNWIKTGAVTINHKTCKPKDKALAGAQIIINVNYQAINHDSSLCDAEDIPLDIVFEDEDLLILNKPAGLVVHPGAGNREHTLVNALLHHEPQLSHLPRAGIIHRLDKETTGLLIVAKSLIAHSALIRQMQSREIQRHYITLVQGHLISGGTIETCFGRSPRNRLKMSVMTQGRQAITHYKIKKQFHDYSLLDVSLMTGRTHQIRVHLAHINHPVVGDPLYGSRMRFPQSAEESLRCALQQFKRQALHACSLAFIHPITKRELLFNAPLPDDFQMLLNLLNKHYEK